MAEGLGEAPMWVRLVTIYIDPAKSGELREFYASAEVSGVIEQQPGYCFHHLLESVGGLGEMISLTAWDDLASAEQYESSGTFLDLLAKFRPWFTQQPELRSYEVRAAQV